MIKDKRHLLIGGAMLISFFICLIWIFTPTFGDGMTGLEFADDTFNKLSKGSSYFIPEVAEKNEEFTGKEFNATFKVDTPENAEVVEQLFEYYGNAVEVNDVEVSVKGDDLGKTLAGALEDSDAMYKNEGIRVAEKYDSDEAKALLAKISSEGAGEPVKSEKILVKNWWQALDKMGKEFTLADSLSEAKIVNSVKTRAIEPGYNYYGVIAQKVSDNMPTLLGLLFFYIFYTLWYGFAIFYIFEGIGLSAEKSKTKAEA